MSLATVALKAYEANLAAKVADLEALVAERAQRIGPPVLVSVE